MGGGNASRGIHLQVYTITGPGMLLIFHTFRTKIIDVHFLIVSGRAVFATRSFQKGNFLLVYGGELITDEEANAREQRDRENVPIYRYFFRFNSKCFW